MEYMCYLDFYCDESVKSDCISVVEHRVLLFGQVELLDVFFAQFVKDLSLDCPSLLLAVALT